MKGVSRELEKSDEHNKGPAFEDADKDVEERRKGMACCWLDVPRSALATIEAIYRRTLI